MGLNRGLGISSLALAGLGALGCSEEQSSERDPCRDQASGTACTWLGLKGESGFDGDGRPRYQTAVNQVQDLLFMEDGNAYFTDFNNYLLRRVLPDDRVETLVGWTDPVFPGDGPLGGIPKDGAPGVDWQLNHPTNLLRTPEGALMVVAWHNHKFITIDTELGWVKVVCGGGAGFSGDGGPVKAALFRQPVDATFDDEGNWYVVDQANARLRRVSAEGENIIETIAGNGVYGTQGDDGPAIEAQFSWEQGSNPNPSGGIVHHQGKLYISDTEANRIRVLDLESGVIEAFAGTGEPGYAGDGGPAGDAQLSAPRDLEIGPDGHLYVADTDNSAVRAIDLESLEIRTVVGTGESGLDEEEQLLATETRLSRPFGLAFDDAGDLYVMDSLNSRIVKVKR